MKSLEICKKNCVKEKPDKRLLKVIVKSQKYSNIYENKRNNLCTCNKLNNKILVNGKKEIFPLNIIQIIKMWNQGHGERVPVASL